MRASKWSENFTHQIFISKTTFFGVVVLDLFQASDSGMFSAVAFSSFQDLDVLLS